MVRFCSIRYRTWDGKRTDTASDANETTNEDGTYSASADLEDLLTLYVNVPVGPGYLLGGIHHVNITTSETLPNSTYGDKSKRISIWLSE